MGIIDDLSEFLPGTIVTSLVMIVLGLVYFMTTLWVVKAGTGFLDLKPDANWILISSAVISAAALISSKISY